MKPDDQLKLMHAALDGEASAAQARELDALLAADAAARAQFSDLQRMFVALRQMPQAYPPEGLVARVMESLPDRNQLSGTARVLGADEIASNRLEPGGTTAGISPTVRPQGGASWGLFGMSQSKGIGGKKLWIGGGVAAVALLAVAKLGFDFPSGDTISGTVVPAERYKAKQMSAEDVKVTAPASVGSAGSGVAAATGAAQEGTTRSVAQDAAQRAVASEAIQRGGGNWSGAIQQEAVVTEAMLRSAQMEAARLFALSTEASQKVLQLEAAKQKSVTAEATLRAAQIEAAKMQIVASEAAMKAAQMEAVRMTALAAEATQKSVSMDARQKSVAAEASLRSLQMESARMNTLATEAKVRANQMEAVLRQSVAAEAALRSAQSAAQMEAARLQSVAAEAALRSAQSASVRAVSQDAVTRSVTQEAVLRSSQGAVSK